MRVKTREEMIKDIMEDLNYPDESPADEITESEKTIRALSNKALKREWELRFG